MDLIPQTQGLLREPIEIVQEPSLTYRLDLNSNIISGMTDGLDAVKQAVYHRLGIERYQYPIYSWEYGLQTYDLYGKPMPYVMPEIKRRIKEALLKDDRITQVDGFSFAHEGTKLTVNFAVQSNVGTFEAQIVLTEGGVSVEIV